ncbi:MAG: DRTGG domain-containing protein [bacterium]|nr:DRTGG domain-containing protein [bacterium]
MTLDQVKTILGAEVISGSANLKMEVKMGCGSDLMSDVLAFIKSDSLLLTGLTNPQAVRTAEMVDVKAICFVRGKRPGQDTIRLAESKGLPLLMTELPMFEACGRLYRAGLPGCSELKWSP